MIQKIWKGIKKFMNDKLESCKSILSVAQNRLVLGLALTGLGIGLITSSYIRISN